MLAAAPPPPAATAQQPALTVFSSLPLQGPTRPQAENIVLAIRLAFKERGYTAGGYALRYVSLDDSSAAAGRWDPAQVRRNARRVTRRDDAIAYIGEFNSPATAFSLPTLNEAGVLQVSPSNTARGLTRPGPGSLPGEPDRYYPTGRRTYGRMIPLDDVQGATQATLMKRAGVRRLFVLHDREPYGRGVARFTARAARQRGIRIVGRAAWAGRNRSYRTLARQVAAARPDAVFAGGIVDNHAARLFDDLHRARPRATLFGPDGVASRSFTRRLRRGTQARTVLTAPALPEAGLPAAGRAFYERYRAEYGRGRFGIDPYAAYGYAAAQAVLTAIDVGGADRQKVVDAFFGLRDQPSVLGRFSIRATGDTSLRRYGVYRVRRGRLRFERAITAPR